MTLIHVPRPPKSAYNPDRPVSALLKTQIDHLHHAERRLPLRYRSEIYTHAIQTEREAANYIRVVTEAIHQAHEDAARQRMRPVPKRKRVIEIAAVADEKAERKLARKRATPKKKSSSGKTRRK